MTPVLIRVMLLIFTLLFLCYPTFFFLPSNNIYLITTLLMTILTFTWRKNKNNVQEVYLCYPTLPRPLPHRMQQSSWVLALCTPLTHNNKLIHNVCHISFLEWLHIGTYASLSYSSLALLFIPQKSILLQKQISFLPKVWMKSIPNTFIRDCPLQTHPSHLRQVSHVVFEFLVIFLVQRFSPGM